MVLCMVAWLRQTWLGGRLLGLAQVTATVSHRYLIASSTYIDNYLAWQVSPDFDEWRSKGTVYNKGSGCIMKSKHASGSESVNRVIWILSVHSNPPSL